MVWQPKRKQADNMVINNFILTTQHRIAQIL